MEGEVDGSGALRQPLDVSLRREDEDLVLIEVDLQELEKLLRTVGVLLKLQQLPEPPQVLIELIPGTVALVHPVSRDAVLGRAVHIVGADLHLEELTAGTEDGGMQRLIRVRLGTGDVVLDAFLDRCPLVMNDAQHVVAVRYRPHDDPYRHEIIDLVERLGSLLHLLEDGPEVLGPAGHFEPVDPRLLQLGIKRGLQLEDGLLPRGTLGRHLHGQLAILIRLQELERQVFQFRLDTGHAEPVRQRGVDLPGFQRDPAAPLRRQVLQRPHVVQPVAQLDDDDAGILGDGQEKLAVVLDLLFSGGVERQAGNFGQAVHDAGHLGTELPGDVLHAHIGVFDYVMQEGRHDGSAVQQLLGQNQRHGDGMRDEVFTRHALLTPVRGRAEAERPLDQLEVKAVGVALEHRPEIGRKLGERPGYRSLGSRHNNPAAAKLTNRSPAMITWSYTGRSSSCPAETSCLVAARSSDDGVGSPLGWLCTTMIPAAASAMAGRKTSRGCTSELFNNPRVMSTSRKTWL